MIHLIDDSSSGFLSANPLAEENSTAEIEEIYSSKSGFSRILLGRRYGKLLILKTLQPQYASLAGYRLLLQKEFKIGYICEHPNICTFYSFENIPGIGESIVMEYVDGCTLREFLDTHKMTKSLALKITREIACALVHIHEKQLIHRDLKPENILITLNGNNVKIIDFGLADSDDSERFKESMGTRRYASPEQLYGNERLDCRSDIYSFGIIIKEINSTVRSSLLNSIADKCIMPNRNDRFSTVKEIIANMDDAPKYRKRTTISFCVLAVVLPIILVLFMRTDWYYDWLMYSRLKIDPTEISLFSNRAHDLSAQGSANCYIVSSHGIYSFNGTVLGNNKKVLGINPKRIEPTMATLLWQDYYKDGEGLITEVAYKDGKIFFRTGENFNPGNAVIGALDSKGNILWSWHIWFSETDFSNNDSVHVYSSGAIFMDRNLGAVSANPADSCHTFGLYYQWGRKDPFLFDTNSAVCFSSKQMSFDIHGNRIPATPSTSYSFNNNWCIVMPTPNTGSIEQSILHPMAFIAAPTKDWLFYSASHLWGTKQYGKTIYDPSPPGWKVADADDWGASFRSSKMVKGGRFLKYDGDNVAWYPNNGTSCSGDYSAHGNAFWTADHYISDTSLSYQIDKGTGYSTRGQGFGIRCVRE